MQYLPNRGRVASAEIEKGKQANRPRCTGRLYFLRGCGDAFCLLSGSSVQVPTAHNNSFVAYR